MWTNVIRAPKPEFFSLYPVVEVEDDKNLPVNASEVTFQYMVEMKMRKRQSSAPSCLLIPC